MVLPALQLVLTFDWDVFGQHTVFPCLRVRSLGAWLVGLAGEDEGTERGESDDTFHVPCHDAESNFIFYLRARYV